MPKRPIDLSPEPPVEPEVLYRLSEVEKYAQAHSLSEHMKLLRRRSHGASRWMGLAIIFGAIIAFVVVSFFEH